MNEKIQVLENILHGIRRKKNNLIKQEFEITQKIERLKFLENNHSEVQTDEK